MGEDQGEERAREVADDQGKSPAQLRAEIEDVRDDLGETAAALAAKTDVKTRAREKADELKRFGGEQEGRAVREGSRRWGRPGGRCVGRRGCPGDAAEGEGPG
jgi:hypothetical protein